jgi:hypothetical protein
MKRVYQYMVVLIMVGCASLPTQEMSDARQAIQAARYVKAESQVPALWAKAEHYLRQAEQNLESDQFNQARLAAILAKEQAVNAHNLAVAIDRAELVWQSVTVMGHSAAEGDILLEKAQVAARQGDVEKTLAFAKLAYRQGELALKQARLEQAKLLIDKVRARQTDLQPDDLVTLDNAEAAYRRGEGKKAYDLIERLCK